MSTRTEENTVQSGADLIRSPVTITIACLALTLAVAACPANGRASGLVSAVAELDSLPIAREMAAANDNCVAAFGLAARQLVAASGEAIDPAQAAPVFRALADIARLGGDTGVALIFADAALALADFIFPARSSARAPYLLTQSMAVRISGQPAARSRARELVQQGLAVALADTAADRRTLADLQQANANLARAAGDLPTAIDRYTQALATRLSDSATHTLAVAANECWRARATLFTGDLKTAGAELQHCLTDLQELGFADHPLVVTILNLQAIIAEADRDSLAAATLYRRAEDILRHAQRQLFPGFSRRRLSSPLLNPLIHFYLQSGDQNSAWRAFTNGHRIYGSQAPALGQARRQDPEFAAKVRDLVTNGAHLTGTVEAALDSLHRLPANPLVRARAVGVLCEYARQTAQALGYKNQLRQRFGEATADVPSVRAVQELLHPDQALVGYFTIYPRLNRQVKEWKRATFAVVVRPSVPPAWIALAPAGAPSAWREYGRLMDKASEWPTRLADDPRVTALRSRLYQEYFAPLEPYLAGSREILLLATELPDGLSFPALIDAGGQPLVDRFTFQHLLGVENLTDPKPQSGLDTAPSLILGDPTYNGIADTATTSDPSLADAIDSYANTVLPRSVVQGVLAKGVPGLAALPRLPNSGWEARGIAGMTAPVTLLTGGDASEQNLERACGGTGHHRLRWVHLASHALMHGAIPERSALALAPRDGEGLLFVEEIGYGWSLNCDLVTLSGCQTGSGPSSFTAGPLGFIQALHAAGARNLLLSTAKVDDIATALLMERFYANIANRASPRVSPAATAPLSFAAALAEAQRWLRDLPDENGRRPFAHPVYWANFRLIGSGG